MAGQSFSSSSSRKTCERNLLYQMECFAGAAVSAQAWGTEGMLPVRELIPDGKRGLRKVALPHGKPVSAQAWGMGSMPPVRALVCGRLACGGFEHTGLLRPGWSSLF